MTRAILVQVHIHHLQQRKNTAGVQAMSAIQPYLFDHQFSMSRLVMKMGEIPPTAAPPFCNSPDIPKQKACLGKCGSCIGGCVHCMTCGLCKKGSSGVHSGSHHSTTHLTCCCCYMDCTGGPAAPSAGPSGGDCCCTDCSGCDCPDCSGCDPSGVCDCLGACLGAVDPDCINAVCMCCCFPLLMLGN